MQNLRKTNETGRSMVEMLGVLAIVGVLSVGGVYGYGVAMKKHKANELLHQASMQASSIAAQIASGKTDLALENFGNSSNGSFSSVKGPDGSTNYQSGDDKFTMQITGMDEAVCKQMQGMKGGTVRSVSCSTPDANGKVTATLAFNKDLSSTPVASDFTTESECKSAGKTWCSGKGSSGACSNSTDCCAGYDSQCCNDGDISSTESCTDADGKTTTCLNGKCEFGTKDCTDEDCCDLEKGVWKCNMFGNCACGPTADAVACPDEPGSCKACGVGEKVACANLSYDTNSCICHKRELEVACTSTSCEVCAPGEVYECNTNREKCACGPSYESIYCPGSGDDCKVCPKGEVAVCGRFDCFCGKPCTSYSTNECGSGNYCQFSSSDNDEPGPGACVEITNATPVNNGTYLYGPSMNWWSASSWCIGNDRKLITYNTLHDKFGCVLGDDNTCNSSTFSPYGLAGFYWWAADSYAWVDYYYSTDYKSLEYSPLCE